MFRMKKLFVIFSIVLIFSGCTDTEKTNEPHSTLPSMIYGENYKFGLLDENGEKLTDAVYESYQLESNFVIFKMADNEFEIMDFSGSSFGVFYSVDKVDEFFNPLGCYVVAKEDGVYKSLVTNDENNSTELKEIPKIVYNIYDENMNLVIEKPFTSYFFDYPDGRTLPDSYSICGAYNGTRYIYKFDGNEYVLYEETAAGETGTEYYGYKITRYCWNGINYCFGLNDPNGDVIFEPIYARILIPFDDRAVLYETSATSADECKSCIGDMSGNVFAEYNNISYHIFDDGTYIGIAESCGEDAYVKCYDENGDILPSGYWFIDKDGNVLSPCYTSLSVNDKESYEINSPDDIITATDEKGNTVEFTARDYICKE